MKIKLLLILVLLCSLDFFAQTNPQNEAQKLLEDIAVSLRDKKYDEVIFKANRVIELSPKSGDVYTIRGMAYFFKTEREKAVVDFTKALELGVEPALEVSTYQIRATALFQLKRYDEAIKDYNILIQNDPADFRGFVYRGWSFFHKKAYEPAIRDFDSALKLNPNAPGVRRFRGDAHLSLGNYEKAVQDATDEMRLSPKEAESYKIRAAAYRKLGKLKEAEADEKTFDTMSRPTGAGVQQAADQTPEQKLDQLLEAGKKHFDNQEYDAAINIYGEVLELIGSDSKSAFAIYFIRGRSFYEKGDLDSALKDYNTVIMQSPDLANGYVFRGEIYLKRKQYESALKDFTKALELDSKDLLAYRRRSEVYYLTQEYDNAIKDATEVLKIDPKYQSGWYYRAVSYLEKGDYQSAVGDFNEFIKLEPSVAHAFESRAEALRKLGKVKEAEADEKKAAELKLKGK
jgi:tetratricopeptide (TPR) repeat protein